MFVDRQMFPLLHQPNSECAVPGEIGWQFYPVATGCPFPLTSIQELSCPFYDEISKSSAS